MQRLAMTVYYLARRDVLAAAGARAGRACRVTLALVHYLLRTTQQALRQAAAAGEEATLHRGEPRGRRAKATCPAFKRRRSQDLRKLQPRLYSVATPLSLSPEQVGFTIETLRHERNGRSPRGRKPLARRSHYEGETVGVYPVKQSFHFDDDRPVIMIAEGRPVSRLPRGVGSEGSVRRGCSLGTSISASIRCMRTTSSAGRRAECCRAQIMRGPGPDHKIYVQDRLREQGEAIWSWLERDAVVFVCGDAQGMALVAAAFAEMRRPSGQADGAAYVASLTGKVATKRTCTNHTSHPVRVGSLQQSPEERGRDDEGFDDLRSGCFDGAAQHHARQRPLKRRRIFVAKPAAKPAPKAAAPAVEIPADAVKVVIEGNDAMQFNLKEVAGSTVALTLNHEDRQSAMGHNIVILAAGTDVNKFAAAAMTAKNEDYVPSARKASVIAATKLLGGGESDTVVFKAPAAGSYDFICSFPGHYAVMKGKFIVE